MDLLGDIFLLVFLFFFIYSAEKWAKSIKKSTEKTAKQLEISFFPVVNYHHFESLEEEVDFWQKWSEKYRKLEEKYGEKNKKEKEKYTKLLRGCDEIIGIFYKLQRKARRYPGGGWRY